MRESNYTFPPQNRAVVSITHLLYDRRALDTNAALALLNNLTSLTYLTSTSPRIREILTLDGGLERLLDILRDSCLPRKTTFQADLWGLNGPPTARVINVDRQISLRHSLAFQCVVNIGVRGSEAIRTRVVQAGALDLVAQILESWLKQHGVAIFAGSLGSQAAVDAVVAGLPVPGTDSRRRTRADASRHLAHAYAQAQAQALAQTSSAPAARPAPITSIGQFVSSVTSGLTGGYRTLRAPLSDTRTTTVRQPEVDAEMADAEGGDTDGASAGDAMSVGDEASVGVGEDSMDVDDAASRGEEVLAGPTTTPRAPQVLLPMALPSRALAIPPRNASREVMSQASSAGNSVSGDEMNPIPRTISDNSLAATAQAQRPTPLNLSGRIPQLAADNISNQSSPMGTPIRMENAEVMRGHGRRGTIVGRPINVNLTVRNERRREENAGSGTSDGGEDVDLPTATIAAGIAAANAQAMEGGGTVVPDEPGPPPNVEIVENAAGPLADDPDPETMAAEQARLDMEAGAPPGQPGAAQTPRVVTTEAATPQQLLTQPPANPQQAQIIIANGAPRGFQDLGSYVGISSLLNPEGDRYSDDSILLALQLLAYLSKYPHVRSAFHHPRRPMHPTFDLTTDYVKNPLPERPAYSETPNIFSLVERFTFRPSPSDPMLFRIPQEIQYWAGVIMRNACRKDEARGGIRQCANMSCGKWETFPREFAKCRRCRKAKYCSKECQSKAWSEGHRFWCNIRNEGDPVGGPLAPPGGGFPPDGDDGPPDAADDDEMQHMAYPNADIPRDVLARLQAARTAQQTPQQGTRDTAAAPTIGGDRLLNTVEGRHRHPFTTDPSPIQRPREPSPPRREAFRPGPAPPRNFFGTRLPHPSPELNTAGTTAARANQWRTQERNPEASQFDRHLASLRSFWPSAGTRQPEPPSPTRFPFDIVRHPPPPPPPATTRTARPPLPTEALSAPEIPGAASGSSYLRPELPSRSTSVVPAASGSSRNISPGPSPANEEARGRLSAFFGGGRNEPQNT